MPQEIAPKTFTFHGVGSVKREGKKGGTWFLLNSNYDTKAESL